MKIHLHTEAHNLKAHIKALLRVLGGGVLTCVTAQRLHAHLQELWSLRPKFQHSKIDTGKDFPPCIHTASVKL